MQITSAAENEILQDIFGEINDGILYRGLYHAKNEEDTIMQCSTEVGTRHPRLPSVVSEGAS